MRDMFKGLFTLALTFGIAAEAQAQSETLVTDVTIVDVAGGTPAPSQSVLIRDGLIAEVIVCWAVVGGILASTIFDRNWLSIPAAALVASVLFGVYHFAHSAPFNTIGMVGFLTVIGLLTSIVFFVSRDVYATVVFHNFLGVFGVLDAMAAQDKLASFQILQWSLIGTAAMALAVLVLAQILIIRRPS